MSATIQDGGLTTKDAAESLVYRFDWEDLPTLAAVQTSVVTASVYLPPSAAALVLDNSAFTTRGTSVRITGGSAGATYLITNTITTNEAPSQTFVAQFSY